LIPVNLSVNVNKYALLRNSRGRNVPDLNSAIDTCVRAGATGITVHPRMDERHIRFEDVPNISDHLAQNHPGIEFNVECAVEEFLLDMVCRLKPHQCTLVPVTPGEITSDHGFRFPEDHEALVPAIARLQAEGIRVSLFADCEPEDMSAFARTGTDRVELYTGPYAWAHGTCDEALERERVRATAAAAAECGMQVNAGHDLDRHNLSGISDIPNLVEVSIGHAQICRALEVGTTQSVQELLSALKRPAP
jgi:pyridoxine 5-phosphate synthase